MSITIHYFFNSPKNLAELAEDIGACLGCTLAPYKGCDDDLFDRFLSMEFSLQTAGDLVNDRDLDFENYTYSLDFRTPWGGADARPIQLPAMLTVIYALHRCLGIAGMLVYNMQILLARYEEREIPEYGRRLYDKVSETPFVAFSDHLAGVVQRLPKRQRHLY